jgi:hypothetical protein
MSVGRNKMGKYEIFLVTVKGEKARVGAIGELVSVMGPSNVNVLDIGQSGILEACLRLFSPTHSPSPPQQPAAVHVGLLVGARQGC